MKGQVPGVLQQAIKALLPDLGQTKVPRPRSPRNRKRLSVSTLQKASDLGQGQFNRPRSPHPLFLPQSTSPHHKTKEPPNFLDDGYMVELGAPRPETDGSIYLVAYPDKISNLISDLQAWEKVFKNLSIIKSLKTEADKGLHQH